MDATSIGAEPPEYELHFVSLFGTGRAFAFPCDASGAVDLDALSEAARLSYRRVCAAVGRDVSLPDVRRKRPDPDR